MTAPMAPTAPTPPTAATRRSPLTVALVRGPSPSLVALALLTAALVTAVLVSTGPAGATPTTDGSGAGQPATPAATADQHLQVLSVESVAGDDDGDGERIEIEVAVPETIGALAPLATNFALADDGRLVDLTVSPLDDPAEVVIALDVSGSMVGEPVAAARTAAERFIAELPAATRIGLVTFGETVEVTLAPTTDRTVVAAELANLDEPRGETALWDALIASADLIDPETTGPSIVVLSDGDDTVSVASRAEAVDRLRAIGTTLHAVAIESPDIDLVSLEEAVALVGGQFLATTELDRLDEVYADIAGRLTNRYRLRFEPLGEGPREAVVSVVVGSSVATSRFAIGGPPGAVVGQATDGVRAPGPDAPVATRAERLAAAGRLADPMLLPIGLGALFASLFLIGLLVVRPAAQIRLEAASGADRLAGLHTRAGNALERLMSRHALGRRLDLQLDSANISLRPGEFLIGWVALSVPLGLFLAATGQPVLAVIAVLTLTVVTVVVLRVRAERRRVRFADQLTDTIGIMSSSLRAGLSLPRSIEMVATEAPAPTGPEFHRIAFEVRVGRDMTESMAEAAKRLRSRDLEWLAQAVGINRELGGDLTEILDNVADTIRERRTVSRQVEALSAEGRATGWMLEAMPVVLFLFSWWRTPEQTEEMLTDPSGRILLAVAVTGMVVGHLWIRRLVRFRF